MGDMITRRQARRMICLESLVLPSLFGPVLSASGGNTLLQFVAGSLLGSLFGVYLIWVAERQNYFLGEKTGVDRSLIHGVYAVRFMIRGTFILAIFVEMVRTFLLGNVDKLFLLIPVLVVTFLACMRTVSGRAKMVELLFWWMLIPIVGIWVLSIGNWKWHLLWEQVYSFGETKLYLIYLMIGLYLPLEGILFFLPRVKDGNGHARGGILFGLVISWFVFFMAYLTVGNDGLHGELFGVAHMLQFVKLPANLLSRLDILAMPFLLLGLFLIFSGTVFYAAKSLQFVAKNTKNNWIPTTIVLTVIVVWLYVGTPSMDYYISYLAWVDIPLAVILPLICMLGTETKLVLKKLIIILACVVGLTGCNQVDMEDKDYVMMLGIDYEADEDILKKEEFEYHVAMADMQGYTAQVGESLKVKTKSGKNKSLRAFKDSYSRNHATTMDFGHTMLLLLEDDIFDNPATLKGLTDMLKADDLISSTVMVAVMDDETKDVIKLDEKEDAVVSESIVRMLKKDDNGEITLMDLYLAANERLELVVPVLEIDDDEKLPKVEKYIKLNGDNLPLVYE